MTSLRSEQCREMWRQRLHRILGEPFKGADALQALADLGAADLDRCLKNARRK